MQDGQKHRKLSESLGIPVSDMQLRDFDVDVD